VIIISSCEGRFAFRECTTPIYREVNSKIFYFSCSV
jgi:hypothetical protein